MLTGENPFYTDGMDMTTLYKAIVKGNFSFPEDCKLSPSAKDLIRKLLVPDPNMRLGCLSRADLDLRDHPWFGRHIDWCQLYRKEITAPWVPPVRDPFDASNFRRWNIPEKDTKSLLPLSEDEQMLFTDF
jgi:serine/threonine protein kinase